MVNFFKSHLNLFNFKEKTKKMTIADLKAFNLREAKIEKEKRFRAYVTEINQRYKRIRKSERNSFIKTY